MTSSLASLVRNVAFSGASFAVVGSIGLMLVPVILNAYGLPAYGLIVLARLFLPTGLLGMFDCGILELATKLTAQWRSGGSVFRHSLLAPIVVLGAGLGIVMAIALALLAPYMSAFAGDSAAYLEADMHAVWWATAAALLILFPGIAIEGVVRGFEKFMVVRGVELASTVVYAIVTLLLIQLEKPFTWVIYAFLSTSILRVCVLAAWVMRAGVFRWQEFAVVRLAAVVESASMGWVFAQGKMLGTVQGQLPVLLIGLLTGPSGIATYDVIMRLPRFLKSVLALTVSVVFPVSARLDAGTDTSAIPRLLVSGMSMVMFSLYPVIAASMVFAKSIMELWIGATLVEYWPWMTLMFGALLTNILLSYGLSVGSVRVAVQQQFNRIFLFQIVVQFALAIVFADVFGERAFVLGQAAAMIGFFPIQISQLLSRLGIKRRLLLAPVLRQCWVGVLLWVPVFVLSLIFPAHSLLHLALYAGGAMGLHAVLAYVFALSQEERLQLKRILRILKN